MELASEQKQLLDEIINRYGADNIFTCDTQYIPHHGQYSEARPKLYLEIYIPRVQRYKTVGLWMMIPGHYEAHIANERAVDAYIDGKLKATNGE